MDTENEKKIPTNVAVGCVALLAGYGDRIFTIESIFTLEDGSTRYRAVNTEPDNGSMFGSRNIVTQRLSLREDLTIATPKTPADS